MLGMVVASGKGDGWLVIGVGGRFKNFEPYLCNVTCSKITI